MIKTVLLYALWIAAAVAFGTALRLVLIETPRNLQEDQQEFELMVQLEQHQHERAMQEVALDWEERKTSGLYAGLDYFFQEYLIVARRLASVAENDPEPQLERLERDH